MAERHYKDEENYILNTSEERESNNHCYSNKDKIKNELVSLTKNVPISELDKILNNIKCNLKG